MRLYEWLRGSGSEVGPKHFVLQEAMKEENRKMIRYKRANSFIALIVSMKTHNDVYLRPPLDTLT